MEISRISRKAEKPGYVRESPPEELLELQDQSTDLFLIYGGQLRRMTPSVDDRNATRPIRFIRQRLNASSMEVLWLRISSSSWS